MIKCVYCKNLAITIIDGDACCEDCYNKKMVGRGLMCGNNYLNMDIEVAKV